MDNINYNEKFNLESKNNISINQYNKNIKMENSKNNNLGLVSKNNLSDKYIIDHKRWNRCMVRAIAIGNAIINKHEKFKLIKDSRKKPN